jgi:lipopolysaccharide biosynthesis regulator YciM
MVRNTLNYLLITLFLLAWISCAQTPLFDQHSFDKTIDAKVESVSLMKKAIYFYEDHEEEVEEHFEELQKIYEYDRRRKNNNITSKMWEIILNEDNKLYAGFIKRWREVGPQNPFFVNEAVLQIEEAFDKLLDYEGAKNKAEQNAASIALATFLNSI